MYAIRSYYDSEPPSVVLGRVQLQLLSPKTVTGVSAPPFLETVKLKIPFPSETDPVIITVITSYSIHYTKLYEAIKVSDNAGNESAITRIPFKVDTAIPTSTIVGISETLINTSDDVSLSGVASDNNGIKSIELTASINGAPYVSIPLSVINSNQWNVTSPITNEGSYDFTITIKDNADRVIV